MKKIRNIFIIVFVITLMLPFFALSENTVYGVPQPERTGTVSENSPLISNFSLRETGNGIYRAEWDISNVTDTVYVRIYAAQDRSEFNGLLVQEIESGTHGAVDVYMPDIDSGYYIFYISAVSTSGIAGYKYCDDYFFYDNTNRQDKLTDVLMCVEKNDLFLMWNGGMPGSVLLYDGDTGELVSRSDGFMSPCSVYLPKGHRSYLIGVASFEGEILGRFDPVKSTSLKTSDAEIRMPAETVTGSSEAEIKVQSDVPYSLKIYKNGSEIEVNETASDQYTVPLDEDGNDIMVFLTDADGKMRAAEVLIDSDTISPELILIGQTDDVRTVDEEITLKGTVDEDAVLKYLGEEVELAGGNFYLRKPLGFGKNQFTLTATDEAGNTTEKTVTVERVFWSQKNILIILLAISVVTVTVIELILLFFRSERKRRIRPAGKEAVRHDHRNEVSTSVKAEAEPEIRTEAAVEEEEDDEDQS